MQSLYPKLLLDYGTLIFVLYPVKLSICSTYVHMCVKDFSWVGIFFSPCFVLICVVHTNARQVRKPPPMYVCFQTCIL